MEQRAVIYVRGLTTEQTLTNLSLPTQRQTCSDYCARHGIAVDRIFIDDSAVPTTTNRPEFQRMLSYCQEHMGRIDYVVVSTHDRISRSAFDHALTATLLRSLGITLRSATEPIQEAATDMRVENILAAFAQFDSDARMERRKARSRRRGL